jgi:hypothetical protein
MGAATSSGEEPIDPRDFGVRDGAVEQLVVIHGVDWRTGSATPAVALAVRKSRQGYTEGHHGRGRS